MPHPVLLGRELLGLSAFGLDGDFRPVVLTLDRTAPGGSGFSLAANFLIYVTDEVGQEQE